MRRLNGLFSSEGSEMKLRILSCAFLMVSGCSQNSTIDVIRWEKSSGLPSPELATVSLKSTKQINSLKEKITIEEQLYRGIVVENAFVKTIRKTNDPFWVVSAVLKDEDVFQTLDIDSIKKNQKSIGDGLREVYPPFRRYQPSSIEPIITLSKGKPEIQWRAVYVDIRGIPWDVRFSETKKFLDVKKMGSQFHEATAWVFPQGPKRSEITEVKLANIQSTPALASEKIWVVSQADSKILSGTESLKYSPQDSRFDQVQVFYFLSRSLEWFSQYLGITLPARLEAEVHMGAPDKTNAAFYYQNKIRLGKGDERTYSNIPQDPSIVIHESVHAVIDAIAGLPFEGEGGSLNEGFADFFTALQINSPHMGGVAYLKGPYRRSIENSLSVAERTGALYHDSGIISGTLWELRKVLGVSQARELASLTLNRMHYYSGFDEFGEELKKVVRSYLKNEEEIIKATRVLEKRGF